MKKLFNIKKEGKTKPKDASLKDKVFAFKKKEECPREDITEETRQNPARKNLFNIRKERKTKPKDASLRDKVFAFKKKEGYPKEDITEEARQNPVRNKRIIKYAFVTFGILVLAMFAGGCGESTDNSSSNSVSVSSRISEGHGSFKDRSSEIDFRDSSFIDSSSDDEESSRSMRASEENTYSSRNSENDESSVAESSSKEERVSSQPLWGRVKSINKTMYAKRATPIYSGAYDTTEKLGTYGRGDEISLTGICTDKDGDTWYVVIYNGRSAFVSAYYLSDTKPREAVKPAPAENTNTATTASGTMVWITAKGKRYHRSSSCSNMKNPYTVTLEQAQASGRTPCRKCW